LSTSARGKGDGARGDGAGGDADQGAQAPAKRPWIAANAGPRPQPAVSAREPSAEDLLRALPEIKKTASWSRLLSEFDSILLSPKVVEKLLGVTEKKARQLFDSLAACEVETVRTLLDACEDIVVGSDGSLRPTGLVAGVTDQFALMLLSKLRDKVKGICRWILLGPASLTDYLTK
jgi:hypothetical protein